MPKWLKSATLLIVAITVIAVISGGIAYEISKLSRKSAEVVLSNSDLISISQLILKSEYDSGMLTALQSSTQLTPGCKQALNSSVGSKGINLSSKLKQSALKSIDSLSYEVKRGDGFESNQYLVMVYQGDSITYNGLSYLMIFTVSKGKVSKVKEQALSVSYNWG